MAGRKLDLGLERFSGIYIWAIFIALFAIWTPGLFLTPTTLHIVGDSEAIPGILGLALLIPLTAGVFDLSVAATINFSAVLVAVLQVSKGIPVWGAIAIVLAACALIGLVNGVIIVKLKVNSFIATLGTTSIIEAVQVILAPTQPSTPTSSGWVSLAGADVGGFQIVVLYLLVIALVIWWVLERTPSGRRLYAIGGSVEAARLAGLKVERHYWSTLLASALLAGVGGVFYSSLSGPALDFGPGLLLPAFAAVFLGSTQLKPGRFNVWGTLLAIYVLATGAQGLELATSQQWVNQMFNGVALVGAVAFAVWRQQGRPSGTRRRRRILATSLGSAASAGLGEAGHGDPAPLDQPPVDVDGGANWMS